MNSFGNLKGTPMKEAFQCTRICDSADIATNNFGCADKQVGDKAPDAQYNPFGYGRNDPQCAEYEGGDQSQNAAMANQIRINRECNNNHPTPTQGSLKERDYNKLVRENNQAKNACIRRMSNRNIDFTRLTGQALQNQIRDFQASFDEVVDERDQAREERAQAVGISSQIRELVEPTLNELEADNAALVADNAALEAENAALEADNAALVAQLEALQTQPQ